MELDDPAISPINGNTEENDEKPTNVDRLQNIVHKLEVENDLPSPKNSEKTFAASLQNGGILNGGESLLENINGGIPEFEFDTNDAEDSWLYESPQKTPGKNLNTPDKWLKDNITTPELMRVRGSLSAKLDVINIEKRKGRFSNTDPHPRKDTYDDRKVSMNSVHSLDWDYDEEKNRSRSSSKRSHQPNDDLEGYSYDEEFDAEKELNTAYNNLQSNLDRQAWSEPTHGAQIDGSDPRPFSLDWSDEEDDLVPMKIDFNQSPSQPSQMVKPQPRNGAIIRRGASEIQSLATPRKPEVYKYDDFVAKPTGLVKPRRANASPQTNYSAPPENYDNTDYGFGQDDSYDDNAPIVPRGTAKRDTPSPRNVGIAKPVQRRKPGGGESPSNAIRPRGSGVKPRGSGNIPKTHSSPDVGNGGDPSLVARIPASSNGDGPVIRRRGAGDSSGGGGIPAPRKSRESPQIARVQGIPQVRRSTGSIPQKSGGDGIARPRRSASPSGMVRPRGSMQNNY